MVNMVGGRGITETWGSGQADPLRGPAARSSVEPKMLAALKEHGMGSPLRGVNDPRTRFPELLITGGWERESVDDGYAYRFVADEQGPHTWEQYLEHHDDGSCLLLTRAGDREQVITRDPGGHISTTFRSSSR